MQPDQLRKRIKNVVIKTEDLIDNEELPNPPFDLEETIDLIIDEDIPRDLIPEVLNLYSVRLEAENYFTCIEDFRDNPDAPITRLHYYSEQILQLPHIQNMDWKMLMVHLDAYEQLVTGLMQSLELAPEGEYVDDGLTLLCQTLDRLITTISGYCYGTDDLPEGGNAELDLRYKYLIENLHGTILQVEGIEGLLMPTSEELTTTTRSLIDQLNQFIETMLRKRSSLTQARSLLQMRQGGTSGKMSNLMITASLGQSVELLDLQWNADVFDKNTFNTTADSIIQDCTDLLAQDMAIPFLSAATQIEVLYTLGRANALKGNLKTAIAWFNRCIELEDSRNQEINILTIKEAKKLLQACRDDIDRKNDRDDDLTLEG